MGRRAKKLSLSGSEKQELENGYRHSPNAYFSRRCHIILLKGQGRTSAEIAEIFGTTKQPINSWVKRYEAEGISGLLTRPGQGRKQIFDKEKDTEKVKAIVKKERQRLKLAKEEIAEELNKEFSMSTLTRFLKTLAVPTNE